MKVNDVIFLFFDNVGIKVIDNMVNIWVAMYRMKQNNKVDLEGLKTSWEDMERKKRECEHLGHEFECWDVIWCSK